MARWIKQSWDLAPRIVFSMFFSETLVVRYPKSHVNLIVFCSSPKLLNYAACPSLNFIGWLESVCMLKSDDFKLKLNPSTVGLFVCKRKF